MIGFEAEFPSEALLFEWQAVNNKAVATHIILIIIDTVLFIVIGVYLLMLPYGVFASESPTHTLAAFEAATVVIHTTVLPKARSTNTITAAITDIPHPFYWILFATAVAGNHNVCHIFFVYSVNGEF